MQVVALFVNIGDNTVNVNTYIPSQITSHAHTINHGFKQKIQDNIFMQITLMTTILEAGTINK